MRDAVLSFAGSIERCFQRDKAKRKYRGYKAFSTFEPSEKSIDPFRVFSYIFLNLEKPALNPVYSL